MVTLPLQVSMTHYDLFLILEDDNLERIKAYDPAEVALRRLPPAWHKLTVRNIQLCYATAEELKLLMGATNIVEVVKRLKVLSRGWQFKPEQGDSDASYQTPAKN